ncbi:MAG: EF-hand domain-containing protein [Pseudomonadota bacterium]
MGLFLPILAGGAALASGIGSIVAGNEAADAASDTAAQNSRDSRYAFNKSVELNEPWRQSGIGALSLQNAFLGVQPSSTLAGAPQGSGPEGIDWDGYVGRSDNLTNAFNSLTSEQMGSIRKQGYDADGDGQITPEEFGAFHYKTMGQNQGYSKPPTFSQSAEASQPANAFAGAQADPYQVFKDSGFYKSRVAFDDANMDQITGQFGAAGSSLSGSHMKALADYSKRAEGQAFNTYYDALSGLSGTGANLSANQGAQGIAVQGQINNQNTNAANAQGSAYMNTANAFGNTVQNFADLGAYTAGGGFGKGAAKTVRGWFG